MSEGDSSYDENLVETFKKYGFKQMILPAVEHAVWTTFPFKSTLSFFIGIARVYPKLAEYIQVFFVIHCLKNLVTQYENSRKRNFVPTQ